MTGRTWSRPSPVTPWPPSQSRQACRVSSRPTVSGYPGASAASRSACCTTAGVGSTGVPMERSTMPPGCARARSAWPVSRSQGKSPSREETRPPPSGSLSGSLVVLLRRQSSDERVVLVDLAHLRGTTGRAEVVEEVDVGVVVLLPLLRRVVLVEDRLDRAHRFAGA